MKVYRLSPELGDGASKSIVPDADTVLDIIRGFIATDDFQAGDSFTVEALEMTQVELDALPEL